MADIVLKDRDGNNMEFTDVPKVRLYTVDGGTQIFSKGEAVSDVPISLDFTGGNQIIEAPEGTLVKSAILLKPDTLKSTNIAKDVEIAGIAGEFIGNSEETEVELNMSGGDQIVRPPTEDKLLSKVTVKKPDTLIPENIAKGVDIGGVVGTHQGGGGSEVVSKTVDLDFLDYSLVSDPADMMLLLNESNYGKCVKYTGETGEYTTGQYYKVDCDVGSSASETSSGTALTANVECNVGDLVIAAFAIRSPLVSLSDGWTLISTSQSVNEINTSSTYYQTLSFACKYAESSTETITVTQEKTARIYINMISLEGATELNDMGYQYTDPSEDKVFSFSIDRPDNGVVIWGLTRYLWTTSNHPVWESSNEQYLIQLGSSTPSRLLLALDVTSNDNVTYFVDIPSTTNDVLIAGTLSVQWTPKFTFTAINRESLSMADSQIIKADEDTVMSKATVLKPDTLIPENIAKGVDIAGILGTYEHVELPAYGNLKHIIPISQYVYKSSYQLYLDSIVFNRSKTERIHVLLYPPTSFAPTSKYGALSVQYGCVGYDKPSATHIYASAVFSYVSGTSGTTHGYRTAFTGNLTTTTATKLSFSPSGSSYDATPTGTYYGLILVTDSTYTGAATMLKENPYVSGSSIAVIK